MVDSEVYFVTPGVLEGFDLDDIVNTTQNQIMEVVLGEKCPKDTRLLTNHKLRKQMLDNPTKLWGNGNTRDTKLPKGTGTPNIYLNDVHLKIRTCENVLNAVKEVHNMFFYESALKEDDILPVVRHLDKIAYKHNGTVDGPPQIEPGTIVSMLILSIHDFNSSKKTRVNKKSIGSICILLGYKEYKEFIDAYLQWEGVSMKNFYSNLKKYNDIIYSYHLWRHGCNPTDLGLPELPKQFLSDEYESVEEWKGLSWFNIPCKVGSMVSWSGDVPWKLEKNSTDTPFMGLYLTTLEASKDWYETDSRNNIISGLRTGIVGKNSPRQCDYNNDELKNMGTYKSLITDMTDTQRLFFGIDKYTIV